MSETSVRPEGALAESTHGLSRRQVVKAGAWAAPAVVLAVAVPAASASVTAVSLTGVRGSGQTWNLTLALTGPATNAPVSVSVSPAGGVTWTTPFPATATSPGTRTALLHVTGNGTYTVIVTVGGKASNAFLVSKR